MIYNSQVIQNSQQSKECSCIHFCMNIVQNLFVIFLIKARTLFQSNHLLLSVSGS